jgi:hypothetical protein
LLWVVAARDDRRSIGGIGPAPITDTTTVQPEKAHPNFLGEAVAPWRRGVFD